MAIKPYRRTGLMTQGFQPSRGYALKEAQNTQLVMADQLDRMSSFFFKQATAGFEEKGERYGAGNPVTLNQIAEATLDNGQLKSDPFDRFDNTVFGRAARKAAMTVLENEVAISATAAFNESVFLASQNGHPPGLLKTKLDGHVTGYVDTLMAVSPALAQKMKAKLSLSAAGYFHQFRTQFASASQTNQENINIKGVDNSLRELGTELDAILLGDGIRNNNPQTLQNHYEQLREAHRQKVIAAYPNKPSPQNTAMKAWDQEFTIHVRSHIINQIFEEDIATGATARNIRKGDPIENADLTEILNSVSQEERRIIANTLIEDINRESDIQIKEDSSKEKENNAKVKVLEKTFATALYGEDHQPDKASAIVQQIAIMNPEKASELEQKLSQYENKRPFSVPGILAQLREKANLKQLEFDDLFMNEESLSAKDFQELLKAQKKSELSGLKRALDNVAIGLNFNRNLQILMSGDDPTMSSRSVVNEISVLAEQEYDRALADKVEFDADATVGRLVAELEPELRTQVIDQYKQNADLAINQLLEFLTDEFRTENGITATLAPTDYQGIAAFARSHIGSGTESDPGSRLFTEGKNPNFVSLITNANRKIKTYLTQINETEN